MTPSLVKTRRLVQNRREQGWSLEDPPPVGPASNQTEGLSDVRNVSVWLCAAEGLSAEWAYALRSSTVGS
jgi:hypothetical protein